MGCTTGKMGGMTCSSIGLSPMVDLSLAIATRVLNLSSSTTAPSSSDPKIIESDCKPRCESFFFILLGKIADQNSPTFWVANRSIKDVMGFPKKIRITSGSGSFVRRRCEQRSIVDVNKANFQSRGFALY